MEKLFVPRRIKRTGVTGSISDLLLAMADGEDGWPQRLPSDAYNLTHATERGFDSMGPGRPGGQVVLPLEFLTRDLSIGTATAGGNLTGSPRQGHTPSLRGFSVLADAGARVIDIGTGENIPGIPFVSTPPVAGWTADEFGAVPESDAVFGLRQPAPKTVGFWFKMTRRLLLQGGPATDQLLNAEILRTIGRAIDKAALQGTGADGQPLGLNGIAGVHAQSGTSLAWAGIQNMLQNVADAGARDDNIQFIGTSAVRELLAQRERAAGSGVVWDGRSIAGMPAAVALECPAATLFAGDFSNLCVALHGGITIRVDRMRQVDGSARVIVMTDCDIFATHAGALSRATSIT